MMHKTKILLAAVTVVMLAGCGVNTSDNVNVNSRDITYFQDKRTDLCFALVATRKTGDLNTSGVGLTEVPCEAVKEYLK